MIVNVEQGEANPSVSTLLRLSDALGIGLPALVADVDTQPTAPTRRGAGATLWRSPAGGAAVLLAGTAAPDVLELWQWTLAVGDVHESEAHTAGTREIIHVTRGTVVIDADGHRVGLGAGDAFAFDGDRPHSYSNGGDDNAVFTLAVFEPVVGTTLQESPHV